MSQLLSSQDHARIERAIADAELRTSGELRVVIHPYPVDHAVAAAARLFEQLGMTRTVERNAILFLLVPSSRCFALYGDEGIHARVGEAFWREVASAMEADFQRGAFADGLEKAIRRTGDLLAQHFPRDDDDRNELSDRVVDPGIVI